MIFCWLFLKEIGERNLHVLLIVLPTDDLSTVTRSNPENSGVLQKNRVKIWLWMSHFDSLFPLQMSFQNCLKVQYFPCRWVLTRNVSDLRNWHLKSTWVLTINACCWRWHTKWSTYLRENTLDLFTGHGFCINIFRSEGLCQLGTRSFLVV